MDPMAARFMLFTRPRGCVITHCFTEFALFLFIVQTVHQSTSGDVPGFWINITGHWITSTFENSCIEIRKTKVDITIRIVYIRVPASNAHLYYQPVDR